MTMHPEHWTEKTREERDAEVVRRLLAATNVVGYQALDAVAIKAKALEIAKARATRTTWLADDGNAEVEYEYDERSDAAQAYVEDGDWGDDRSESDWVTVYTRPRYYVGDVYVDDTDDRTSRDVEIEPVVPDCADGHEHSWVEPYEVLGGLIENPGCWGHGGGVIQRSVCEHCGCLRTVDTWAQRHDTGEQGLTSVEYRELGSDHAYADAWREWHEQSEAD